MMERWFLQKKKWMPETVRKLNINAFWLFLNISLRYHDILKIYLRKQVLNTLKIQQKQRDISNWYVYSSEVPLTFSKKIDPF